MYVPSIHYRFPHRHHTPKIDIPIERLVELAGRGMTKQEAAKSLANELGFYWVSIYKYILRSTTRREPFDGATV